MLANRKPIPYGGSVTQQDIPLTEYKELIDFVENLLLMLTNDDVRENALTQKLIQLSIFHQDPVRWALSRENINAHLASEDIGISHRSNEHKSIFVFEAKRLDNTLPKSRKEEYVLGAKGGIERFKRDKHGKSFSQSGMLGYVQTDDFSIWETKINKCIDEEIKTPTSSDLSWSKNDKLYKIHVKGRTAKYSSQHTCLSKKQIQLIHLWVDLVNFD